MVHEHGYNDSFMETLLKGYTVNQGLYQLPDFAFIFDI